MRSDTNAAGSGSGRVTVNTYVEDALKPDQVGVVAIKPVALEPLGLVLQIELS
jgi:hypothetical protein